MAKSNQLTFITSKDVEKAERQIKDLQIPYDYDSKEYPIEVLLFKFKTGEIKDGASIYIPHYQRDFVWTEHEMSRFIESLLLGVPIQPIFGSLDDKTGFIEIIDGSQRIRTVNAFVNNKLTLVGLTKLPILNGFKFQDLSTARQNKFQTISLRFQIISDKATEEIKQDIFYRINTSGNKASDSEVRKGSFGGKFYDFIIANAKNALFRKLAPLSAAKLKRGDDQELVLRFFAYCELGEAPKVRGKQFLDDYLKLKKQNGFDKDLMQDYFLNMLNFVKQNFETGFAKSLNSDSTPRVRFEAIAVGTFLATQYDQNLKPAYMDWVNSKEFNKEVASDGSNNAGRLTSRVNFVRDCLLNKIKKDDLTYEKN